jgi:hypothetical protein
MRGANEGARRMVVSPTSLRKPPERRYNFPTMALSLYLLIHSLIDYMSL